MPWRWRCSWRSVRERRCSPGKFRRASCPMRIRATCSCTFSFRMPLRSSARRTLRPRSRKFWPHTPGVEYTTTVAGFSLLSFVRTTYNGFFFVTLKDWGDRSSRQEQYQEILQHVNQELAKLPDGFALSFPPPAIPGRRHLRRIHLRPGRPRRQGRPVSGRQSQQIHGRGPEAAGNRRNGQHVPA